MSSKLQRERKATMKKRIVLRPIAVFDRSEYWRAAVERYLDGVLVGSETSPHAFPTQHAAEGYADAQACGVIDELLHHYGDRYMFTILHPLPPSATDEAASTDVEPHAIDRPAKPSAEDDPLPGFLLRESHQ
jgi:hypothetical protein